MRRASHLRAAGESGHRQYDEFSLRLIENLISHSRSIGWNADSELGCAVRPTCAGGIQLCHRRTTALSGKEPTRRSRSTGRSVRSLPGHPSTLARPSNSEGGLSTSDGHSGAHARWTGADPTRLVIELTGVGARDGRRRRCLAAPAHPQARGTGRDRRFRYGLLGPRVPAEASGRHDQDRPGVRRRDRHGSSRRRRCCPRSSSSRTCSGSR